MTERDQAHWTVVINRITCRNAWTTWQAWLEREAIPHTLIHSQSLDDLHNALSGALASGVRHFLFVGGDGTMHHGCNGLLALAGDRASELTVGLLPCGTGNDWVRTFGQPNDKLAQAIRHGSTRPMHVLRVEWSDGRVRFAINMLGGALDAAVVRGLKRASLRIPSFILYPYGLMKALLKPHTWTGTIETDRQTINGAFLTLQAGFGRYCGGGMNVLPHAEVDQPGLLVMRPKSLLAILLQTPDIYNGRILRHKEAIAGHFDSIRITHAGTPIPLEADGEWLGESPVQVRTIYGAMHQVWSRE